MVQSNLGIAAQPPQIEVDMKYCVRLSYDKTYYDNNHISINTPIIDWLYQNIGDDALIPEYFDGVWTKNLECGANRNIIVVYSFKEKKDAMWFMLTWS